LKSQLFTYNRSVVIKHVWVISIVFAHRGPAAEARWGALGGTLSEMLGCLDV
jgi:hypothetical protein